MTATLITGANRGLGFEVARQLTAAGHQVWIGARDHARGQQAADALGARFVPLDVTDDASVASAAETVGALDVLVNNAGISGGRIGPNEATADDMRIVFDTNVSGAVRVLRAFIPLLQRSSPGTAPNPGDLPIEPGAASLRPRPGGEVWGSRQSATAACACFTAGVHPPFRLAGVRTARWPEDAADGPCPGALRRRYTESR